MGIMMTSGGPIDEYLRATGKTKGTFDGAVTRGDAAATSIFAAEVLFKAISDLIESVENLSVDITSSKS